jgi:predicted Ser/Thr protein kinase
MSDMYSSSTTTIRLAKGTRLNGIFEIDAHIASGGMGEIYSGHAIETGDSVAIKVMRSDLADNTMALALFRKEASALHFIYHDAIVRYYVFSLDPGIGRHYLAMEFVDGQPLSELLKSGPLSFETTLDLLERLAGGLNAAHQHGIIHRDLSPDTRPRRSSRQDHRLRHCQIDTQQRWHDHRLGLCRKIQLRLSRTARTFQWRRNGKIGHLQPWAGDCRVYCRARHRHGRQSIRRSRKAPQGAGSDGDRFSLAAPD